MGRSGGNQRTNLIAKNLGALGGCLTHLKARAAPKAFNWYVEQ